MQLAPDFHIAPLPLDFLARARAGLDDLSQPVEAHIALGGEPLRDCLRRAAPGEAILLASYCPFKLAGPYREYGPVFIAAAPQALTALDPAYLGASFVLRAYSSKERIVDARLSGPMSSDTDLRELFAMTEVEFVLVRFAAYGCMALRIERA